MATAASRHVVAVVRIKTHYVKVGSWRRRALDVSCLWKPGPPTSAARFRSGHKGVCYCVGVGAVSMQGNGSARLRVRAIEVAGAIVLLPCSTSLQNQIRESIGSWNVGVSLV